MPLQKHYRAFLTRLQSLCNTVNDEKRNVKNIILRMKCSPDTFA